MQSAVWIVLDTNFVCWVVMKETMSTSALLAKKKVVDVYLCHMRIKNC